MVRLGAHPSWSRHDADCSKWMKLTKPKRNLCENLFRTSSLTELIVGTYTITNQMLRTKVAALMWKTSHAQKG